MIRATRIVVAIASMMVALACGSAPPGVDSTPVPSATPAPSALPLPTATPTVTPPPTATPAPTATATATPLPTATPTPIPPIEVSGSGQTVTDPLTLPGTISRITLTHTGRRNFIVTAYRADGTSDLLVNKIGAYTGVRPIVADAPVYFEIAADGEWTIRIEAIGGEPGATALAGSGDYVSGLFDSPGAGPHPYALTHTGERNFIVQLYCAGGSDLIENTIGAVDGAVVAQFGRSPCFWEIQADGDWTLAPK